MPPKKIDPKLVTKSITSFGFNKITKAEAELRLLEENLQAQKLKVNREHEQRKINDTANRATLMASLVDSTTVMQLPNENDDNNYGNRVGDAFQKAIEQIGNHVEMEQFQITKVKKVYKERPAEWREILELSDSSDSEEEKTEKENDIVNTKRVRKSSVMVGSVKRGKCSH